MKKALSRILIAAILIGTLCGCKKEDTTNDGKQTDPSRSAAPVEADFFKTDADMFTVRDLRSEYDEGRSISIKLNGNCATADSNSVKISGSTVTITEDTTHILSGTLNGTVVINAPDTAKLQLVLNGVHIKSDTSAALYVLGADKVFVTLAEGTQNTLENGGSFAAIDENNIDAVLFSKQDLTLGGSGTLTVISPAGHGIVCKDDLVITGGNYTVTSASHAIDANDSVRVTNATLSLDAGKDGIHAENTNDASLGFVYISGGSFDIEAEGDGISAAAYMQILNGTFRMTAGGGSENGQKQNSDSWGGFMGGGRPGQHISSSSETDENSTSMKALKATSGILIEGGNFTLNSADDAVHSNTVLTVNGGSFEIASGDDGFHADETLTVTAGTVTITECYEGLEALDIDIRGGDISLTASDDGLNAAGGVDQSGTGGRDNGMYGGKPGGGPGGIGGGPDGMSASANGSIVISGGTLKINSSGDGMDANGTLTISGGHITVTGPTQGDTATLDYDVNAEISGGTFIGTGASGMAQTFSDSAQGVISVSVGNQAAGTAITLTDKNGNTVLTHTPDLSFAVVILSSPDMVSGETYTITVGSASAEFKAE